MGSWRLHAAGPPHVGIGRLSRATGSAVCTPLSSSCAKFIMSTRRRIAPDPHRLSPATSPRPWRIRISHPVTARSTPAARVHSNCTSTALRKGAGYSRDPVCRLDKNPERSRRSRLSGGKTSNVLRPLVRRRGRARSAPDATGSGQLLAVASVPASATRAFDAVAPGCSTARTH